MDGLAKPITKSAKVFKLYSGMLTLYDGGLKP